MKFKKVLITGAKGFIGRNLEAFLLEFGYIVETVDKNSSIEELKFKLSNVDFLFHFAGVNRSDDNNDFIETNIEYTKSIIHLLQEAGNIIPIMYSSSIHVVKDNIYGKTKRVAEELIIEYSQKCSISVYIYRFHNVFGKWSKPNYNSVVSTFCYNIANGQDIRIKHPETNIELIYIDDLLHEMKNLLEKNYRYSDDYYSIKKRQKITIQKLADIIKTFPLIRVKNEIKFELNQFEKNLYSTYLTFLPTNKLIYNLNMHEDTRGSFTEFLRFGQHGQISVNISKPKVTKGNHWHHSKVEKFLVVSGKAKILLRNIYDDNIIKFVVDGQDLKVVDIPPGFTHSIINIGNKDMVTIIWANYIFDPNNPDTYTKSVLEKFSYE